MNGRVNSKGTETGSKTAGKPASARGGGACQSPQQELQALSRRCLAGLFVFLLISTCFFWVRSLDLLAPLAESTREFLGSPPPPGWTTVALASYLLSSIIILLDRTSSAARPSLKWQHLVYRTIFFLFYGVAAALEEYFLAVFVAGLVMYGLELLNIWSYSMRTLPPGEEMAG